MGLQFKTQQRKKKYPKPSPEGLLGVVSAEIRTGGARENKSPPVLYSLQHLTFTCSTSSFIFLQVTIPTQTESVSALVYGDSSRSTDSPSTVMTPSRCSILTAPQHSTMMAIVWRLFSLCSSLSILIYSLLPLALVYHFNPPLRLLQLFFTFFNS